MPLWRQQTFAHTMYLPFNSLKIYLRHVAKRSFDRRVPRKRAIVFEVLQFLGKALKHKEDHGNSRGFEGFEQVYMS